jgi:hypothetical protein
MDMDLYVDIRVLLICPSWVASLGDSCPQISS